MSMFESASAPGHRVPVMALLSFLARAAGVMIAFLSRPLSGARSHGRAETNG
jgi:hypothetical protein